MISTLFKWLVHICRFGLVALFLFTAVAKLAILRKFAGNVAELLHSASIDYERWQWPVTIAVIVVEIIVAGLLIIPRTARVGAVLAALMLVGFSGFALLCLRAARRGARVRLFWRNHRQPVGSKDGAEKPRPARSGINRFLRDAAEEAATRRHKKHRRAANLIRRF